MQKILLLILILASCVEKKPAVKEAPKDLSHQNNVGNPANDFVFFTPEGVKRSMYEIKADHLLLYFYNPECEACRDVKLFLMNSPVINSNLKSNRLTILAVYIDKDEVVWKKHLPEMPQDWVHGRDENEYLYRNKVYDLRAIPTIYLLDKNKKVLLKDGMDISEIEQTLHSSQ